jgi:hypothetical protein
MQLPAVVQLHTLFPSIYEVLLTNEITEMLSRRPERGILRLSVLLETFNWLIAVAEADCY